MRKRIAVVVPKQGLPPPEVKKVEIKPYVGPNLIVISDHNKMSNQFPDLDRMYVDLNDLVSVEAQGFRSKELRNLWEHRVARQRTLIRNFEKENNISRPDHLRWAGF